LLLFSHLTGVFFHDFALPFDPSFHFGFILFSFFSVFLGVLHSFPFPLAFFQIQFTSNVMSQFSSGPQLNSIHAHGYYANNAKLNSVANGNSIPTSMGHPPSNTANGHGIPAGSYRGSSARHSASQFQENPAHSNLMEAIPTPHLAPCAWYPPNGGQSASSALASRSRGSSSSTLTSHTPGDCYFKETDRVCNFYSVEARLHVFLLAFASK
jgi:hypothetical protein